MAITCDVAILGGGTGGYVAAIRAAQLGKNVVIIEQDKLGEPACTAAVFRANHCFGVPSCMRK